MKAAILYCILAVTMYPYSILSIIAMGLTLLIVVVSIVSLFTGKFYFLKKPNIHFSINTEKVKKQINKLKDECIDSGFEPSKK